MRSQPRRRLPRSAGLSSRLYSGNWIDFARAGIDSRLLLEDLHVQALRPPNPGTGPCSSRNRSRARHAVRATKSAS